MSLFNHVELRIMHRDDQLTDAEAAYKARRLEIAKRYRQKRRRREIEDPVLRARTLLMQRLYNKRAAARKITRLGLEEYRRRETARKRAWQERRRDAVLGLAQ